mgnify:CR=1 FL=1
MTAPVRRRSRATARAAGKDAERALVEFCRANGAPHAERRIAGATAARGDIAGIPGVVLEQKAPGPGQPVELGSWLDETMRERENDGATIGLLVVKRRSRGNPGDWYWVTDGNTMAWLLRDAGWFSA